MTHGSVTRAGKILSARDPREQPSGAQARLQAATKNRDHPDPTPTTEIDAAAGDHP